MRSFIIGDGEKSILLIHGWMHSSKIYEDFAKTLSNTFRVCLIDLPGFGESSDIAFAEQVSIEALSKKVEEYLIGKDFNLIYAHSLGAASLLRILERGGKLPAEKIIFSNPAYLGISWLKPIAKHRKLCEKVLMLRDKLPYRISNFFIKLAAWATINSWELINDAVIDAAKKANVFVASQLLSELSVNCWRVSKKSDTQNYYILISEKDRLIAAKKAAVLSKDLNCSIDVFKNIGHTPVVEAPERLLEYLKVKVK